LKNHPAQTHRAFFLLDTLFGLIIVSAVTVTLVATVRHERAAEIKLRDSTSALHLAEHALLNLQHAQPMPATEGDTHLSIRPATGGIAPAGYTWAKVDATVHGHQRELIGLIPIVPTKPLPTGERK
jgi:type II secretory pathway pseudopilin PulG